MLLLQVSLPGLQAAQQMTTFRVCSVGAGDGSVLRESSGRVIVIDAGEGPNGPIMRFAVEDFGFSKPAVVVVSHVRALIDC